ncbi:MAG: SRPBCC family protein [Chloroflexia bacterium]
MTTTENTPHLTKAPVANTAMLIRKPVAEVFAAFIDPAITTHFWFTRSSGRLTPGAQIRWDWEMYNVGTDLAVKEIEENRRIVIEWQGYSGLTTVEWQFTPHGESATFVGITESGFQGDGDSLAQQAIESTGGFTFVLCGLKAYLEHNIHLNLIADRHPANLVTT